MRHQTLARPDARASAASGLIGFLLLLICHGSSGWVRGGPPTKPLKLDQIIESMEAFGERVGAVRVRWHETADFKAGGLVSAEDVRGLEVDGVEAQMGIPPHPMRSEFPSELLLKDSWMRYATKSCGEQRAGGYKFDDEIASYDGVESRQLVLGADESKDGFITAQSSNWESNAVRLLPLMLYLRPFSPPFNILVKEALRVQQGDVVVKGRHCVLVTDGHKRVWIDPGRACVPIRIEESTKKRPIFARAEVEYVEHDQLYWTPISYRVEVFDRAKQSKVNAVYEANRIVVEANLSLGQRDFGLSFPAGTAVYDGRNGERYKVAADGSKVSISGHRKAKLGIPLSEKTSRWMYLVSANALCLVAILCGWAYSRR